MPVYKVKCIRCGETYDAIFRTSNEERAQDRIKDWKGRCLKCRDALHTNAALEAERYNREQGLPPLVADLKRDRMWAETVRYEVFKRIASDIEALSVAVAEEHQRYTMENFTPVGGVLIWGLESIKNALNARTLYLRDIRDAKWWIDNRYTSIAKLLHKPR